MKNISKYLGAGLLLFTAACSQTQEGDQYTPNKDDAKAIHFIQSSIQKEFPQDAVQGVINVEIARPGNKGAYKVYLATKDDDYELFSVPAEATIPVLGAIPAQSAISFILIPLLRRYSICR